MNDLSTFPRKDSELLMLNIDGKVKAELFPGIGAEIKWVPKMETYTTFSQVNEKTKLILNFESKIIFLNLGVNPGLLTFAVAT